MAPERHVVEPRRSCKLAPVLDPAPPSFAARAAGLCALIASAGAGASACGLVLGFEDHELFPDAGPDAPSSGSASGAPGSSGAGGPPVGWSSPVILASAQTGARDIALDGQSVYWVAEGLKPDEGFVGSVAKGGGTTSVLTMMQSAPRAIAVDGTRVFWTIWSGGSANSAVATTMKSGESSLWLYFASTGVQRYESLAIEGTTLVIGSTVYGGQVIRGDTAGTAAPPLATAQNGVSAVAVRAGTVYWLSSGDGEVRKLSSQDSAPVTLSGGQDGASDLAVDASALYWTSNDGTVTSLALSPPGSEPNVLAEGQSAPRGISVDDARVYWANSGDGTVMAVSKAGGAPVAIASGFSEPFDTAADAEALFFADRGGGVIVRVDKLK